MKLFLTPADISALEQRGENSVCRDLRNGFYRGASGGGERPWRVLCEAYEKQFGATPGSIRRDKAAGDDLTLGEQVFRVSVDFWSRVDRSGGPDACWLWTGGSFDTCGYGRLSIGGKKISVHRIALALATGEPIEGRVVRHSCDNPPCCNPAHLSAGTHRDNMADRGLRDRAARGARNGRSRINEETAILIIRDLEAGGRPASVARTHAERGATFLIVREIHRGKTWKHLPRVKQSAYGKPEAKKK